jgi:hypothetical protein
MLSFPYKLALNFVVKALSSHDYGQKMDQNKVQSSTVTANKQLSSQ